MPDYRGVLGVKKATAWKKEGHLYLSPGRYTAVIQTNPTPVIRMLYNSQVGGQTAGLSLFLSGIDG